MLSNVIGHEPLLKQIKSLFLKGVTHGSYLFHGPPSVGKRTVAFELSRYLLCTGTLQADCSCESCKHFLKEHPDFLCLGRTANILTGDIDVFLKFVSSGPFLSNKKIVVFDGAENMSWEASNRLLKHFEEPYQGFIFFLISSRPDQIPLTLKARCIPFSFERLSSQDITNILWKKLGYDIQQAQILGWVASCAQTDIFSQTGAYLECRQQAMEFLEGFEDINRSLDFIDRIADSNIGIFSDMVTLLFCDILLIKYSVEGIINTDFKERLEKVIKKTEIKKFVLMNSFLNQSRKYSGLNINLKAAFKNNVIKAFNILGAS